VFPLVAVLSDTYKFVLVLLVLLALCWSLGLPPSPAWLAIPVLLLSNFLAISALTTLVAACVPLVPDTRFALDSALHVLMFLSGIFYYREQMPESTRWVLDFNPFYHMLSEWRSVLVDGRAPSAQALALDLLVGTIALVVAMFVVRHLADRYAKAPQ
jgi:lipopolysaccharide transport system permease protein